MDDSKYSQRGVSAKKEDVYKAIAGLDKGLFPKAFCKIFPDYFLNDKNYCTISCRLQRSRVIKNEIRDGDVIVGFASYGKATYEDEYNSGIGSNGLTAARHDVLSHSYFEWYPETFDAEMKASLAYAGSKIL